MASEERVYLIHFERQFEHARHYVGYCRNLRNRIFRHRRGAGSRLLYHVQNAGIRWYVVRTWAAPKAFEKKLKRARHNTALCPICTEKRDLFKVAKRWRSCNASVLPKEVIT